MKHCPNLECPARRRDGHSAEYVDEATQCSECQAALVDGAPLPRAAAAVAHERRHPAPLRALLFTLACPLLLWLIAPYLGLPGVDVELLAVAGARRSDRATHGLFALGLIPFLNAMLLVELAALVVPRWRRLRDDWPTGRAQLLRAALVVTVLLAALQGYFVAVWMESASATVNHLGQIVASPGMWFRLSTALSLVGGVMALVGLCWAIDRHGLGNGVSVLLAGGYLISGSEQARKLWGYLETQTIGLATVVSCLVLVGGVIVATGWILRRRVAIAEGVSRRQPIVGVVPLDWGHMLVVLPLTVTALVSTRYSFAWLQPGSPIYFGLLALVALVLAPLLAAAFHRPTALARRWARLPDALAGQAPGGPLVRSAPGPAAAIATLMKGRVPDAARLGETRFSGLSTSLLWLGVLVGALLLCTRARIPVALDVVALAVCTAVVLDLATEWRMRRRHGELVAVWSEQRLDDAELDLTLLREAGIPACLRTAHHRALLHFFAPYLPVVVAVPAAQAAQAQTLLERLHR